MALVEKILAETPDIRSSYLEVLADYLVLAIEKKERKQHKILTENRLATVNKRETSFEGLSGQFENEDGIYSLINEDKNTLFCPKISITQDDLDTIPCLRQLREAITQWEAALKRATGRDAFIMKKALIEMRRDQYIIKQAYKKPTVSCRLSRGSKGFIPLDEKSKLIGSRVQIGGISFMNPKVVQAILCNYSRLKQDSYGEFEGDTWYLMEAFDALADEVLKDYPIYNRIVELKIDGVQNQEIRKRLKEEFDKTYTVEYLSALWRNKIPKIIAAGAKEQFLAWQYKVRGYPMKVCSKCGKEKPANNVFFSRNNCSADGWYSICKACRRKKGGNKA